MKAANGRHARLPQVLGKVVGLQDQITRTLG
jgi:hypothetical protein